MRLACLAALPTIACTLPAVAQPLHGFYVQGDAGIALPSSQPLDAPPPPAASTTQAGPTAADRAQTAIAGAAGPGESGSLGYGLGNGVRVEVQGIHLSPAPSGG